MKERPILMSAPMVRAWGDNPWVWKLSFRTSK
jgi:hypothetical protein